MIVQHSSLTFPFKAEKIEEEITKKNLKADQEVKTNELIERIVKLNPESVR